MNSIIIHILALGYGVPFILVGIEHFRSPQKFVDIVPNYLPFALFLVYLTGIMEVAGGWELFILKLELWLDDLWPYSY